MQIVLEKYHGLGNDYLVFDPNKNELELNEANVKMICNRNVGLGSDGILEGPLLGEHLAVKISGRKCCRKERKRSSYFCKIFKRRRICTEKEL